jgi:uncharacterized protein YneR
MEDLSKILDITGLVRNTIGVVIAYLTDPPILPYIDELEEKTEHIREITHDYWYYSNSEVKFDIITTYHNVKYKIRYSERYNHVGEWLIRHEIRD